MQQEVCTHANIPCAVQEFLQGTTEFLVCMLKVCVLCILGAVCCHVVVVCCSPLIVCFVISDEQKVKDQQLCEAQRLINAFLI